jgi:hypothetical protein
MAGPRAARSLSSAGASCVSIVGWSYRSRKGVERGDVEHNSIGRFAWMRRREICVDEKKGMK